MIEGYDIGIDEGHKIMVNHMIDLHKILRKKKYKNEFSCLSMATSTKL